ncbi:MAG: LacI family transcriptional regulator, partial [Spirochaetales bacterium]
GYKRKSIRTRPKKKSFKYVVILHYETQSYLWNFSRPFISELETILLANGYYPLVMHMLPQLTTEEIIQEIKLSGAGAIFAVHYVNDQLFESLENLGIPIVIINNSNFQKKFFSVLVDDFQGAYEGTEHLIELGHRNMAYLEYNRPDLPAVIMDRFFGFKKAIDGHNLVFDDGRRISLELTDMEGLSAALKRLFAMPDRPTALFVHDDYYAASVLAVLAQLKMKVPADVSVIAPGDVLDYLQPFLPQITTMRINTSLMVRTAWDLMMNRLHTMPEEIHVLKVKQTLVKRGSCAHVS